MLSKLYVARVVSSTSTDGVGLRNSLYVSDCHIGCKGCNCAELWDIKSGTERTVEDVFAELKQGDANISILGGEPLMQYPAILELCKLIKKKIKKTIWLWTGYELPYLEFFYGDLLKYVDVVIDGPFYQEYYNPNLKWRGSTNQKVWEILHDKHKRIINIQEMYI